MRTEVCDNCGAEAEAWTMKEICYGRGTKRLCPKCYGQGSLEVTKWTIKLQQKRKEENER